MKLIIQIPCYNEAESLPVTLKQLPRKIKGIDKIEWLIIDDGSIDSTVSVAKKHGVDHIVHFKKNRGLAEGFKAGIDACIALGADIIVNTDADNQYNSEDIPKLVQPILEGTADIVIGARPIARIRHFSMIKKLLQKFGSYVVRRVSKTDIPDAPSGFRAISRDAAMKLNVFNAYTYTLETIIQAGRKNMAITWIPVRVNEDLRPSRLVKSIPSYIKRSIITIFRIFIVYEPFRFFIRIGLFLFLIGFAIGIRFLYYFIVDAGQGHIQSLILASILMVMGFQSVLSAFIVDLMAVNRTLLEDIQYRLRKDSAKTVKKQ
jgi:glycosyltransferase involved in cell wall biosynthesis